MKSRTALCASCGERATVVRKDYRMDNLGVPAVLRKIDVIECPLCGSVTPVIPNLDGLMRALAVGILCSPCSLSGMEVRFLRKYVNKSAKEFARYLHLTHYHLSDIETGKDGIGPQTDRLIRMLVAGLDSELATEVQKVMEAMRNIDDSKSGEEFEVNTETLTVQYS